MSARKLLENQIAPHELMLGLYEHILYLKAITGRCTHILAWYLNVGLGDILDSSGSGSGLCLAAPSIYVYLRAYYIYIYIYRIRSHTTLPPLREDWCHAYAPPRHEV